MRITIILIIYVNICYGEKSERSGYNGAIFNAITGPHLSREAANEIILNFKQLWHPKLLFDFVNHKRLNEDTNSQLMIADNISQVTNNTDIFNSYLLSISNSTKKKPLSHFSSFKKVKTILPNIFWYLHENVSSLVTSLNSTLLLISNLSSEAYPTSNYTLVSSSISKNSSSESYPTSKLTSFITSQISNSSLEAKSSVYSTAYPTSNLSFAASSSRSNFSSIAYSISNLSSVSTSIYNFSSTTYSTSNSSFISSTIYNLSSTAYPTSNSSSHFSTISTSLSTDQTTPLSTINPDICLADLLDMGEALLHSLNYTWVLKMLDSMGKPSSGILDGSLEWYGFYEECFVNVPAEERPNKNLSSLEGKYCLATFSTSNKTQAWATLFNRGEVLKEGLCVPSSCSEAYLKDHLNSLFKHTVNHIPSLKNLSVTELSCPPRSQRFDSRAIGILFLIGIFLLLMFLGTFYDLIIHGHLHPKFKPYYALNEHNGNYKNISSTNIIENGYDDNDKNQTKNDQAGIIGQILLSFSIYSNASKIFNVTQSEGTLSCIHGIRFLSLSWVIVGHSYIYGAANFSDPANFLPYLDRFFFQAIENTFVSVDSFFLLSGTLVCYTFMKMYAAGKVSWINFYLHRFWRLTSPYMLILGTYVCLMKYLGEGPLWKTDGIELNYCANSWWYNLLYINNFGTYDEMCMGWTWYLANDMQFYIISPIILYLLVRNKLLGFLLIGILMLGSWIASGIISSVYNLPASPRYLDGSTITVYMEKYYVKPYCRIGPYLIGIILGYILHSTKCKYTFKSKWIPLLGWCVAIIINLSVVYGLVNPFDKHPLSNAVNALYNSLNRTGWAVGVSWVIFTCVTGYAGFVNTILSWKLWIPLSRLSYCAYLIHPILMYIFYYNQKYQFMFNQYLMLYLFLPNLMIAFAVAFVLSLAFESPMMGLEKIILSKNKKTE